MSSAEMAGPLAGYRVLELGSTAAGPFCARLLADFGAEVIKIEPQEGDSIRTSGKLYKGKSLYAASIMRNKQLISVNLRDAKGQDIARKLAQKSDIVVENFRPGTLEQWNLGYADLSRTKPEIIMVRISGYGQDGPYAPRPGYGVICEAAGGLRHLIGDADRPPARVAMALTDYLTGLYAAFGATMALLYRSRTGKGQYVDAALAESALSFIDAHVPAYEKMGVIADRAGSGLAGSAPNNLYATSDGKFVLLNAAQNTVFKRFARAIDMPHLVADARFSDMVARGNHQQEIDDLVTKWTCTHKLEHILSKLAAANVPATGVATVADVFLDPHFRARNMLVETPDDDLGTVTLVGPVPKLSLTPGSIRKSGGRIGQDTRTVLSELLGLTGVDVRSLEQEGVIYCDSPDET